MKTKVIQDDRQAGRSADRPRAHDPGGPDGPPPVSGGGAGGPIRRHPLVAFFALAFVLTWAPLPFGVFMAGGPLIAAFVIAALVDGRAGLRALVGRILRWRVAPRWYAAALLVPPALVLSTISLNVALGADDAPFEAIALSSIAVNLGFRLVFPLASPLGEEPGFRGFALPRLQFGRSPLTAALILGLLVAAWHVPLIWTEEDLVPISLLATVAVTFWYTWLFNRSGGSALITILAHAAEGAIVVSGSSGFTGADETQAAYLYTAAWSLVAIGLVVFDRRAWRAAPEGAVDRPEPSHPARARARSHA